jgi:hypothetical protein
MLLNSFDIINTRFLPLVEMTINQRFLSFSKGGKMMIVIYY